MLDDRPTTSTCSPIAGVKVFILGHEDQAVFTDAQGRFTLRPRCPTGDVKLVIDGRTATNAPAGHLLPRDGDGPDHPAGRGQHGHGQHGHAARSRRPTPTVPGVYLPRLQTSILQTVSNTPADDDRRARPAPHRT